MGYLFQNYALFPNMTVRQNILCGLRAQKDKQKREQALSEIIALLQLEGLEDRRPSVFPVEMGVAPVNVLLLYD